MTALRRLSFTLLLLLSCPALALELTVKIEGVEGELQANLSAYVDLIRQQQATNLTPPYVQQLYDKAEKQIRQALQPFGYYQPTIKATLVQEGKHWLATFVIKPGPVVHLRAVDILIQGPGNTDPVLQRAIRNLPLHPQAVLRHAEYEQAKKQLINLAQQRGYFDARYLLHRIEVDLDAYAADVKLHLDSGPRYRFGAVTFEQEPAALAKDFLGRYLPFQPGDAYEAASLTHLRQYLSDSGYFTAVDITLHKEAAVDQMIPITVSLKLASRSKYRLGLGYGTDSGARSSFGFNRRLNRRGHKLDGELRLAQQGNSAKLIYQVPLTRPWQEQLGVTASYRDESTDTSNSTIKVLRVEKTGERGSWLETLSLEYSQENYVVGTDRGTTNLLVPGMTWSKTHARNRMFTRNGYRIEAALSGSPSALGSNFSYLQAELSGKYIRSFNDRTRAIVRGDIGYTDVTRLYDLPASKRFFAGGDQSVRGYGYQTLGPLDASGNVTGGKHLLVGSVELERLLSDKWSTAVFYDVGNAINAFSDPLKHGAGLGLRWRSPIGPVRFDIAWALSKPNTPWRVHIVIGPDL